MVPGRAQAQARARRSTNGMNVIDACWRTNPWWRSHRHQLATCSGRLHGKMTNNIGRDVTNYLVTDPSDDPLNPRPGTLRHAMTNVKGKVWVTFARDMNIKLAKPLLISSFSTIDGRGVNVHIAYGACLFLQRVCDQCDHPRHPNPPLRGAGARPGDGPGQEDRAARSGGRGRDPDDDLLEDMDRPQHAVRLPDGLIDVTRGSTEITISNNRFKFQDKVMLLGHDDGFRRDKDMRVTVVFNHFGPHCQQRMPSSLNGNFKSIHDVFENGASFRESVDSGAAMRPNYRPDQMFRVADGRTVRSLTNSAGALTCPRTSRC
ncbi:hypothetical protein DH2020_041155 [Rehmannia glutinosa]|uniref:Pectate lyase n=1 Tax=Rehmannia glutinosa TaxID=99300 RepID=A0ABR0URN1_REHGL